MKNCCHKRKKICLVEGKINIIVRFIGKLTRESYMQRSIKCLSWINRVIVAGNQRSGPPRVPRQTGALQQICSRSVRARRRAGGLAPSRRARRRWRARARGHWKRTHAHHHLLIVARAIRQQRWREACDAAGRGSSFHGRELTQMAGISLAFTVKVTFCLFYGRSPRFASSQSVKNLRFWRPGSKFRCWQFYTILG